MRKEKLRALSHTVVLLGEDEYGIRYWLGLPKWECEWYWSFGVVYTFTNNRHPERTKDLTGWQHIDSSFLGYQEVYDKEKQGWKKGEYIHNLFDSPKLKKKTFTKDEGWKLSELFRQFYLLKNMAEFCHKEKPGCHITESPVDHGNMKDWYNKINQEMIPRITDEIVRMLSPE